MTRVTALLTKEHRRIDRFLDRLQFTLESAPDDVLLSLTEALESIGEHYRREEPFLAQLRLHHDRMARKLDAQHSEALELAASFMESIANGQPRDALALARRFHAIAQHNNIEEERDVFPLADRCFRETEQEHLLRTIYPCGW